MRIRTLLFLSLLVVPSMVVSQSFLPVYQAGSGTFKVDYTIGGDMENEEYFMLWPTDLGLDSRSNLFVLDDKGFCIKKFDSKGKHIKTFGRKGEGPGEIMCAVKMIVGPNDNVVIYDYGNNRFSIFANDASFLKSVGLGEMGWRPVSDIHMDSSGRLYVESRKMDYMSSQEKTLVLISRMDLETMEETVVDSVLIKEMLIKRFKTGMASVSEPFHPELIWGIMPSGNIIIANSENYVFKFYSPDLKIVNEIQHEGDRQEVFNEDEEEYFSTYDDDGDFSWVRNSVKFPKYKPYFVELLIDADGYLLFQIDENDEETQIFDVFTPDGKFVNKVELPRMHKTAILKNEYIYTIKRPEDDDPLVVRYLLE